MFALTRSKNILKTLTQVTSTKFNMSSVHIKNAAENLNVNIQGEHMQFPYVWLRDNCQCEKCFHYSAKSRILDWSYFDPNITPKDILHQGKQLQVTWPDGHKSTYNYDWLKYRSFTTKNQELYTKTIYKPEKITWQGTVFQKICSKHDYNNVMRSDQALYDWLHSLSVYGVALIENTPDSETALDAIVNKIGFTKQTHYGVKFVVQSVQNTANVAYLSSKLQMHTDLPYYEYGPGANLLHCLVQTSSDGGENLLSDSHYVANYMKVNHPEEFKLLTEVEVEWSDVGTENGFEFFKLHRCPVIVLDRHKAIMRISFSIPQRGSYFPGPVEHVVPWYKAHSLFYELSNKFAAKFKNQAGNILTFDNVRLLHGREAYEDQEHNVRKLIGGYVDWDEIYSRLRCLRVKLNNYEGVM